MLHSHFLHTQTKNKKEWRDSARGPRAHVRLAGPLRPCGGAGALPVQPCPGGPAPQHGPAHHVEQPQQLDSGGGVRFCFSAKARQRCAVLVVVAEKEVA